MARILRGTSPGETVSKPKRESLTDSVEDFLKEMVQRNRRINWTWYPEEGVFGIFTKCATFFVAESCYTLNIHSEFQHDGKNNQTDREILFVQLYRYCLNEPTLGAKE